MAGSDSRSVPRTPEGPTPEDVFAEMSVCEPYTVGELEEIFEDASRWTIQRRLDTLVDDDEVSKKKHAENRVSYWIPK